ncbi:MAG: hypothetical protein P1R58_04440 [bacterium]|nr:hypothetical protein [bacterium]
MKSSFVRVAAILLCLSATAFAQPETNQLRNFNFDFGATGARAEAMGRASIGLSDGITGGTGNPAGLYMHDMPIFGISYSLFSPRGTTEITEAVSNSGAYLADHIGSFRSISSANFLAPIRIKGHKFVGSINYFRNYSEFESVTLRASGNVPVTPVDTFFTSDYSPQLPLVNEDSSSTFSHTEFDETQGGLDVVNFGFGTRLSGSFSFGLALNVYTGKMERIGLGLDTLDGVQSRFIAANQAAEYVVRKDVIDTLKFSGVNFTLGLKYNKEKFTAGLIIRTPLSLGVGTERTLTTTVYVNGLERTDFRFSLLSPKIDPPLSKYELPLMIGIGGSYQVKENFLVAADLEMRQYSSTTVKFRDSLLIGASGNNTEFYTEFDPSQVEFMKWQDAIVVRLGGEYLKEMSFGTVPIRAGFGYVPVPPASIQTADGTTFSAKTVANMDLSFGTGVHWEQIKLDLAYTYTIRDRDVFYIDYKYKNHRISFSFTGVF